MLQSTVAGRHRIGREGQGPAAIGQLDMATLLGPAASERSGSERWL